MVRRRGSVVAVWVVCSCATRPSAAPSEMQACVETQSGGSTVDPAMVSGEPEPAAVEAPWSSRVIGRPTYRIEWTTAEIGLPAVDGERRYLAVGYDGEVETESGPRVKSASVWIFDLRSELLLETIVLVAPQDAVAVAREPTSEVRGRIDSTLRAAAKRLDELGFSAPIAVDEPVEFFEAKGENYKRWTFGAHRLTESAGGRRLTLTKGRRVVDELAPYDDMTPEACLDDVHHQVFQLPGEARVLWVHHVWPWDLQCTAQFDAPSPRLEAIDLW